MRQILGSHAGSRTRLVAVPALLAAASLLAALPGMGGTAHAQPAGRPWSVYVTRAEASAVTVIDNQTHAVTDTISSVLNPLNIAITPDAAAAYVVNADLHEVSVISTATHTVTRTIGVGAEPEGIAIAPDGKTAYVANLQDNDVSVIDTATGTAIGTIPVGDQPIRVAIAPDGKTAYVTNYGDGTVSVINTATRTVTDTIPMPGRPVGIATTPDGRAVYVADGAGVSVISTATGTVTGTIPTGRSGSMAVAITPGGKTAYADELYFGGVDVISTATNTVTHTISIHSTFAIAITPDGKAAYITRNHGGISVSVVDTAASTITDDITLGTEGFAIRTYGIAITPDQAPHARLTVRGAEAGQPATLNASASTVKYGIIARYHWDFGDGTSETTTSPQATHVYAHPGRDTVTLTETSSGGTTVGTFIFTGQTASRVGSPLARTRAEVTISPAPAPRPAHPRKPRIPVTG